MFRRCLYSVCDQIEEDLQLEVVVSVNGMSQLYADVIQEFDFYLKKFSIHIVKNDNIISLDENMLKCYDNSTGEYVFYLGDDDVLIQNELRPFYNFLVTNTPDIVILNGEIVDENLRTVGNHYKCPDLKDQGELFLFFRDKAMFGATIVSRKLISRDNWLYLNYTKHAYGCFWIKYLEEFGKYSIGLYDRSVVKLYQGNVKSYNQVDLYLDQFPTEMELYRSRLNGFGLELHKKFDAAMKEKHNSYLFQLFNFSEHVVYIKENYPFYYRRNKLKLHLLRLILLIYRFVK